MKSNKIDTNNYSNEILNRSNKNLNEYMYETLEKSDDMQRKMLQVADKHGDRLLDARDEIVSVDQVKRDEQNLKFEQMKDPSLKKFKNFIYPFKTK